MKREQDYHRLEEGCLSVLWTERRPLLGVEIHARLPRDTREIFNDQRHFNRHIRKVKGDYLEQRGDHRWIINPRWLFKDLSVRQRWLSADRSVRPAQKPSAVDIALFMIARDGAYDISELSDLLCSSVSQDKFRKDLIGRISEEARYGSKGDVVFPRRARLNRSDKLRGTPLPRPFRPDRLLDRL